VSPPQGRIVPCDFIGIVRSQQSVYLKGEIVSNHDELMSNFFAQVGGWGACSGAMGVAYVVVCGPCQMSSGRPVSSIVRAWSAVQFGWEGPRGGR